MTQEQIYLHKMTQEEIDECKRIKSIIETAFEYVGCKVIQSIGNPIYSVKTQENGSVRYMAGGDCYETFYTIKDEEGFHYYIVSVGDRGYFTLTDFDEWYEDCYKEYHKGMAKFNAICYELLRRAADERKIKFSDKFTDHRGIPARINYHSNTNRCSLHLLHGYNFGMATDSILHELAYEEPVFIEVKCHCGHVFFFNDSNIPVGKKYECSCPECKSLLMRKKV